MSVRLLQPLPPQLQEQNADVVNRAQELREVGHVVVSVIEGDRSFACRPRWRCSARYPMRSASLARSAAAASNPNINIAIPPVLVFFRAVDSRDSKIPGARASRRKSAMYQGKAIGCPASGCPGGTTKVSAHHSANAVTGSSGQTPATTVVLGRVNSLIRRSRSRILPR